MRDSDEEDVLDDWMKYEYSEEAVGDVWRRLWEMCGECCGRCVEKALEDV